MSSDRDQQLANAREIDRVSTIMLDLGVKVVKRNPLKVGGYVVGLLLCLFFNGWSSTPTQLTEYNAHIKEIDYEEYHQARDRLSHATSIYYRSKGWFSCDPQCKKNLEIMKEQEESFKLISKYEQKKVSEAKASLGLFSEYGISETRELFWKRFGQGQNFATRQSKWDFLFMGIGAMGRDEKLASFLLRVVITWLFNFTIGVCGAVIAFMWGLWTLVTTYQENVLASLFFFSLASIAAISFAMTWLIGLYVGTAGTVYVGAKFLSTQLRLQSDGSDQGPRRRVHY